MTIETILSHILNTEIRVCITELWITLIFLTCCIVLAEIHYENQDVYYWIIYAIELYFYSFFIYFTLWLTSLYSKVADVLGIYMFKINEVKDENKSLSEETDNEGSSHDEEA